jgi:DNA polymerase-3 subunit delta'
MSAIENRYLPWHESNWQVLQNCREQDRLPHALLFVGTAGVGKKLFAKQFAKSLLCFHPKDDQMPCQTCSPCRWFEAQTHPDFVEIMPEDEKKPIRIDQIRNLIEFNHKTARVNSFKVMIIYSVHALNVYAANALLKTLEEPAENALIILVTEYLMMLPATVRSRCQIIYFPVPNSEIALHWLKKFLQDDLDLSVLLSLAQYAPLKVLDFVEQDEMAFRRKVFQQWSDLIHNQGVLTVLSEEWSKLDISRLLAHWKTWIADMIILKQIKTQHPIQNQDLIAQLNEIAAKFDLKKLYSFLDELNQADDALRRGLNLNPRLMIENLLIG